MGLFSAVGGIIGGIKGKKASKKAAKAQIAAMQKGITQQGETLDYLKGIYNPYMQAGTGALGGYQNLLGLGGAEAQQSAIDQLQQSPFYQSLYRRGEEALLQNASATGGLRGGNTQRSLADFGADTLATTIDRQLASLGGLINVGTGATGQVGSAAMGTGNNITNLLVGQGQAKADDYMRRAALSSQIWGNVGGFMDSAASAVAGGIGAGGGFGAMGAGGAPFNLAAMGNSMLGAPGLFGSGSGAGGISVTGLPQTYSGAYGGQG